MSRRDNLKLLTAAVNEGVYGADAILAGTPVALLTSNLQVTPIEGETLDRPIDDGQLGGKPVSMINTHVKFSGYVEVAGAGDAETIVPYYPILAAAGYIATVGTDEVTYERPQPGLEKDASFYAYKDGVVHRMVGARATFTTMLKVNEISRREFELTGLNGGHASNASLPAANFSAFQLPSKVGATNTAIEIDGTEYKCTSFELVENVEITYEENTVNEEVYLTDYLAEGTIIMEAPAVGTFDPIAIALAETQLPITVTHGIQAGRIEMIEIDTAQLLVPSYEESAGRIMWSLPFKVIGKVKLTTK